MLVITSEINATCPGFDIVANVPCSSPDMAPNSAWVSGFQGALVKHPDATAAHLRWEVM